jgi:hypothetical protein
METIIIHSENQELLLKIKNYITGLKVNFDILNNSNQKIESFLLNENTNISIESLKQRIEKSELDYKKGNVLTQKEVIEISKNW